MSKEAEVWIIEKKLRVNGKWSIVPMSDVLTKKRAKEACDWRNQYADEPHIYRPARYVRDEGSVS